jgi:hypothetical protein
MNVLMAHEPGKPQREDTFVTVFELPWAAWVPYFYWRLKNSTNKLRPRASWAQLFDALHIKDTSGLLITHMDADTIPSILDVPPQRVKFRDLGILAFMLGFSSVTIDTNLRTFKAQSPFATISTEEIQTVGKVLRFEGDILALHTYTCRCLATYLLRAISLVNGQVSFGKYVANGFAIALDSLASAIKSNQDTTTYDSSETDAIRSDIEISSSDSKARNAGYLMKEGAELRDINATYIQQRIEDAKLQKVIKNNLVMIFYLANNGTQILHEDGSGKLQVGIQTCYDTIISTEDPNYIDQVGPV